MRAIGLMLAGTGAALLLATTAPAQERRPGCDELLRHQRRPRQGRRSGRARRRGCALPGARQAVGPASDLAGLSQHAGADGSRR